MTTLREWGGGPDPYRTESLDQEGFIHFSTAQQVAWVANDRFLGREDLVILVIDGQRLENRVVFEDCYQSGQEFPHLYGALNRGAVVALIPFPPDPDGRFRLPPAVDRFESPLLDPLDDARALIEPSERFRPQLPRKCLVIFFEEVVQKLREQGRLRAMPRLGSPIGPDPVYLTEDEIVVVGGGVGGPLAAGYLEELIALGCDQFIVCGGAGSLHSDQELGRLVVVDRALRDEGVSHHYLPAGRQVAASPAMVETLSQVLAEVGAPFLVGSTWTTDGLYRETPDRIARRRGEGCLTVEMEAASYLAVAQFRGVQCGQLLYCGDDLSGEQWDSRRWTRQAGLREKLYTLCLEALRRAKG